RPALRGRAIGLDLLLTSGRLGGGGLGGRRHLRRHWLLLVGLSVRRRHGLHRGGTLLDDQGSAGERPAHAPAHADRRCRPGGLEAIRPPRRASKWAAWESSTGIAI